MTEQEVRRYLRKMSEQDSQTAFRDFYDMTYDRLFRIAFYYTHHEEWSQEIVLDVFMKLWEHRKQLLEITNIEDYCFMKTFAQSLATILRGECSKKQYGTDGHTSYHKNPGKQFVNPARSFSVDTF